MVDKAHKQTDADIKKLEKVLKSVYSTAQSDLKKKWDKCMDRMQKASEAQYKAYTDALKSGDKEKAKIAKEAYQNTLKKMTSENWYKEQMDVITDEMTRLNERALAYTKDKVPKVYKQNYKAVGSSVSKQIPGYSFHMVDESTVKRMTKRLTAKKLNVHKDKRWNTKKANSQIMQGILQGESIGDIAKRLENVTNSTFTGALRTARTMMTEAQNAGRMDSYTQMEEDGLILNKVWVATPDNHVRDSHLALDGQEVGIHEPFETINGNELMYPGDPDGAPEEIYNCRCTMITHVVGFIDDNGVEHSLDYLDESDAHAEAIEQEKELRGISESEDKEQSVEDRWSLEERESVLDMEDEDKAVYLLEEMDLDEDSPYGEKLFEAYEAEDGSLDKMVNDYFDILDKNGDPTPDKEAISQVKNLNFLVDEKYKGSWDEMRKGVIKDFTGYDDTKAEKARSALYTWCSGEYETAEERKIIDKFVDDAKPYKGTIYRGLQFREGTGGMQGKNYDDFMKDLKVGGSLSMNGPSSWASDEETSRGFAHMSNPDIDSVLIKCVKNRTSVPIDFMNHHGEYEVLANSKAKWTILNITETKKGKKRKTIITVIEKRR